MPLYTNNNAGIPAPLDLADYTPGLSSVFEQDKIVCVCIIGVALLCAIGTAIWLRHRRKPIHWPTCILAVCLYGIIAAGLYIYSLQLEAKANSYNGVLHTLALKIAEMEVSTVDMSSFLFDGKRKVDPERAKIIQQKIKPIADERYSLVLTKLVLLIQSKLFLFAVCCACLVLPAALLIVYLISLVPISPDSQKRGRINLKKATVI